MKRTPGIFGSAVAVAVAAAAFFACSGSADVSGTLFGRDAGSEGGGPTTFDGGPLGEGGALDLCPGVDLESDAVMTFDLKPVHVTGKVTLNGAAFPADVTSRGSLSFVDRVTKAAISVPVPPAGTTYDLTLSAGRYAVLYAPGGGCAATNALPCDGGVLVDDANLATDGSLDTDVRSVHVSGSVTLNGAAVPTQETVRGDLVFLRDGLDSRSVALGLDGTFSLMLFPGVYSAAYASQKACSATTALGLPCNGGVLKTGLRLDKNGVVDFDLTTARVQGNVTLNGGAIPADRRGTLLFTKAGSTETGTTLTIDGVAPAPATYAATLLAGTYDVNYVQTALTCAETTTSTLPCNGGLVKAGLSLTTPGVFDVDIPTVRVRGMVTVNGAAVPTDNANRGAIAFTNAAGSSTVPLVTTGAAVYAATLFPATYDIGYIGVDTRCVRGAPTSTWPCNAGTIKASVPVTTTGALDLDVPAARVQGRATLAGAPVPDEGSSRGALGFIAGGKPLVLGAFPPTGEATYAATLVKGTYDVTYMPPAMPCGTSSPLPCNGGIVKSTVALQADGALDVDIAPIHVSGGLTVKTLPPATTPTTRGKLTFAYKVGSAAQTADLPPAGAINYLLRVLKGRYVVTYEGNGAFCSGLLPPPAPMPCNQEALAGCTAP